MQLRVASAENELVRLECEGEIRQDDVRTTNPFEDLMGPGIFAKRVLLSLEKTVYIDSSGIGWLLVSNNRFHRTGGKLVCHSLPPRVQQTIQFLRIDSVVRFADDENRARELVTKSGS